MKKDSYVRQKFLYGSKFGNQKPVVDGIRFDSKREANRYKELLLMQKAGQISKLKLQVKFELIPTQRNKEGKVAEYPCSYYADFAYYDKDNKLVVEDAKGFRTQEYVIKRKLMRLLYGIEIKEV